MNAKGKFYCKRLDAAPACLNILQSSRLLFFDRLFADTASSLVLRLEPYRRKHHTDPNPLGRRQVMLVDEHAQQHRKQLSRHGDGHQR